MTDAVILLAAGFLTGISTILFGFGGGFVVVPLVYHLIAGEQHELAMHIAVATSTTLMILNAGYASYSQWRRGALRRETVIPLFYALAGGALIGALIATRLTDGLIRLLFILYMLVTIIDCVWRKGFLQKTARRPLSAATLWLGGPAIGVIAAMLGVGGSVMTVPLLRRHGYEMKYCVSAANPLSIAIAVMGAGMYGWLGYGKVAGVGYLGYVNLGMLAWLALSGMLGMVFARYALPKMHDGLHARVYVWLLVLVLVSMLL
ncbi:sulfite exporter TauE/SafE family protein [Serratia rhizosphaerae]